MDRLRQAQAFRRQGAYQDASAGRGSGGCAGPGGWAGAIFPGRDGDHGRGHAPPGPAQDPADGTRPTGEDGGRRRRGRFGAQIHSPGIPGRLGGVDKADAGKEFGLGSRKKVEAFITGDSDFVGHAL
ncbi:hypothetical protein DFAR_2130005 [Desulfarculales bacterium]